MNLNPDQIKAVELTEGPVRIIAGPGSGKTRTIVSKIQYIIEKGMARPDEILAITFTNKSANEIKERINSGSNGYFGNVYTYHGWCNYFLRVEYEIAKLASDFRIIDSSDSKSRITKLINEFDLTIDKSDAINAFDKIAREELSVKELAASEESLEAQVAVLWEKYNNNKKMNGELDFNDLIIEVRNLLSSNEELAEKWRNKYKYIFIDEFQDTNNIQFEIIRYITNSDSNITVVGDPDQNIYSWRGANIELINNFEKWYPKAQTIMLRTNYRSTPEIIDAANKLIVNNVDRVETFFATPEKGNGKEVEIVTKDDEQEGAFYIVREIKNLQMHRVASFHEVAIIVRSSYKTRSLEFALNYLNVPYKVIGAMKFFDRVEVKQTLKFVSFVARQDDNSLLDIINEPPKKFGPQKIMKTRAAAQEEGLTMWQYINKYPETQSEAIQEWIKLTSNFIEDVQSEKNFTQSINDYMTNIGYFDRLFDEENRVENIREAIKIINTTLSNKKDKTLNQAINDFVNSVSLESASDKGTDEGMVNIVTSHASKGTEFPVVFLYDVVEGHWPSSKGIESGNIEEERRVMYVAMTRAMNRLYITTSDGFNRFNKPVDQSRFIDELFGAKTYNYKEEKEPIYFEKVTNEELDKQNQIGNFIVHNTLGKGKIIDFDSEFITVRFESGEVLEILKGHQSYRVIE